MPRHFAEKPKKPVGAKIALAIAIVLFGVMAFSAYQALSIYIPQKREQDRFQELRSLIENVAEDETDESASTVDEAAVRAKKYEKLMAMNGDMKAWLKIDGTVIDYPVMQTTREDGEYYLHRDFDEEYSYAGCLFVGKYCDPDTDIFIIYGHNMNNGSMFGDLDKYADADYAEKHQKIILDVGGERRIYSVFAAFRDKAYTEEDSSFKYYEAVGNMYGYYYDEVVDWYLDKAVMTLGERPQYPQQVLLLSTCSYHTDNGRFVVAAQRVE